MRILATLLLPLALLACAASCREEPTPATPTGPLRIVPLDSGPPSGLEARVEVASDPASRSRGLMRRKSLPPDTGMLFIYPDERPLEFWMKNTLIPLSICFIDRNGRIVRILDMEPDPGTPDHPLPRYGSGRSALYALEMERGWFRAHGVREGDVVVIHASILAVRAR
jgi:uncharacterized membrane protein (UPF0127 family)